MITEVFKWVVFATLLLLTYQDFKYRAISWWVLVPSFIYPYLLPVSLHEILTNALFLLVQLTLTFLYFKIKGINLSQFLQNYLGIGDVLFFFVLVGYFSTINYILFFNISLLFSLLIYYFYRLFYKKSNNIIPLAGLQALCLSMVLILPIDRYNSEWIYTWIA